MAELAERCNVIEESYEFMLAYAAQGVADGTEIREYLSRAAQSLKGLSAVAREELDSPFVAVLERDATDALAAVELALAQSASIHLRALLTDLFLIDEVLKAQRQSPVSTT